jgi:hypothetical protein
MLTIKLLATIFLINLTIVVLLLLSREWLELQVEKLAYTRWQFIGKIVEWVYFIILYLNIVSMFLIAVILIKPIIKKM